MTDAGKRLVEAVENCCATWDHNCGRVFESMGRDNPKASAIVPETRKLPGTKPAPSSPNTERNNEQRITP